MHEMSLAVDVVDNVIKAALETSARKVSTIYLTIGNGRDIVVDLFEGLIAYLSRGTIAEGAEVVMNCVPYTVCCNDCGWVYSLDIFSKKTCRCPSCGETGYTLNSGLEFWIDRIEVA
ncbi:MAG: hydrogenase maturation nickel metallochaperone HypA [Coriobacteriales bacterium]|jgi:hydrogenase nickel incorporation protein HypA/HybF|nr:hydrogenase maturation nickel metallochaperone HypA [Coriobacteriales bacterium]